MTDRRTDRQTNTNTLTNKNPLQRQQALSYTTLQWLTTVTSPKIISQLSCSQQMFQQHLRKGKRFCTFTNHLRFGMRRTAVSRCVCWIFYLFQDLWLIRMLLLQSISIQQPGEAWEFPVKQGGLTNSQKTPRRESSESGCDLWQCSQCSHCASH